MIKRHKAEKWAARSERLAAALRENLKRRKVQARSRAAAAESQPQIAPTGSGAPDFRRNPGPESGQGEGGTRG
jgi:hypothetical protein